MFRHHVGEDAAAHVEAGGQAHVAGLGGLDQVVEDAVGDVLVEMALVAEAPDVELQALQLDADLVGDVVQGQDGEIRLPGLGAEAGEFRNLHVDLVIPVGSGIREGF